MTKSAIQFTCLMFALIGAAHADTYRWVDENGVVNFAEQKPRGVPDEAVTRIGSGERSARTSAPPASSPQPQSTDYAPAGVPADSSELSEDQQEMLRELQEAETDRQEQVAKIRQDNCDRSRRVLNNLSAKSRIRVRDASGSERALSEDERQQRIADAQRGIVENCES